MIKNHFKLAMGILLTTGLSTACSNAPREVSVEREVCTYQFSTDTTADNFVDSIVYFCLQHNADKTLGQPSKISRSGDNIVIADYRHGRIFAYDSATGKLSFVIDATG